MLKIGDQIDGNRKDGQIWALRNVGLKGNIKLFKSWKDSFFTTSFAFLPIAIYWALKEFHYVRPFWVFYDHIETLYYYTSIELTQGLLPHNLDNPGTLVQLAGAPLIYLTGDNPSDFQTFQLLAHLLIFTLSFLVTIVLIRRTMGGVDFWLSTTAIWSFFIFPVALMYLHVWGPEPFYYIMGLIAIATLFWLFENRKCITHLKILLAGIPIGLLLSIKFTFVAWVAAFIITLVYSGFERDWKSVISRPVVGLLGIILGFVIVTYPVWEGYPYMFEWLTKLSTREGAYGSGASTLPSMENALVNWKSFLLGSKVWVLLFCIVTLFTLMSIIKKNKYRPKTADQETFLTIFALSATLFSMLLIIRMYEQRYLLPVGLCGLIMSILWFKNLKSETKRPLGIGIAALVFLILLKTMAVDFNTHQLKTQHGISLNKRLNASIVNWSSKLKIENPVVIYGWRVPQPSFALRQHAYYEKYQEKIDDIYPYEGHHTPWLMSPPQPSKTQTFRLPLGSERWDFAIIRNEYIEQIPVTDVSIIDRIDNYLVIRPQSVSNNGL